MTRTEIYSMSGEGFLLSRNPHNTGVKT